MWSNDIQAPLVAVFVNSASMEDAGFTAVCNNYNAVVTLCGLEPMRLLYLDCPFRDGPGAARRLPSVARPTTAAELDFIADGGTLTLVSDVASCDVWVKQFEKETTPQLGFDLEWRAPQKKGDSRGKVATLQLVSLRRNGTDQLTGAIFSLTKLGTLPPALVRLLGRSLLAGVNVSNDLDKLESDRLPSADRPSKLCELSTLAPDVLRVPAAQVSSLEKVLARCCPGRSLNKRLVDVRRTNWEAWPPLLDAQRYAINDAYAGALAQRRLLHPDRRPAPPQRVAPMGVADTSGGGQSAGAVDAAARVLDGMDGELHAQLFGDSQPVGAAGEETADSANSSDGAVDPVVHTTVLEAASNLIRQWDASGATEPLELPRFLTGDDRGSLHAFCQHRGLSHETIGEEGDKFLRVGRQGGAGAGGDQDGVGVGGDIMTALAFDEAWASGLIKYDPRHWMGNW